MARRLEYEITTDASKGIKGLKDFSSAAKKELNAVADSADDASTNAQKLAKVLSGLASDMESELKEAAEAAEALGRALGPEIAGRADLGQITADLNKMGLSFDEIKADADVLAGSLKRLDAVQLSGIGAGATSARRGMNDIVDGADQANSATANMVGNVTQDLGQIAGVAGSAGVAVGQIGEYFTDTLFKAKAAGQGMGAALRSFGGAALPIAGIAAGMAAISHNAEEAEERTKRVTEATEELTRAVEEQFTETASQLFSEVVLRAITDSKDLNEQFREMARLNLAGTKRMLDHADAIGLSAESQQMLRDAIAVVEAEERQATRTEDVYGSSVRATTGAVESLADMFPIVGRAVDLHKEKILEAAEAQIEFAEAARDAAVELVDAQDALNEMGGVFNELERSEDAMQTAFDLGNAPLNAKKRINDIHVAISDLQKTASEELDLSVNLDPDEIGIRSPFRQAIDSARDAIQTDLKSVIAVDGADAARTTALSYIARVTDLLGGAFTSQEVAEMLGLDQFELVIKTQLEQESLAEARAQLELLAGLPGANPLYVAQVQLALDAGTLSPQAASVLLAEKLGADYGLDVPTELLPADPADLRAARAEADAFVAANPLLFGSAVATPDPEDAHRQAQIIAEALKIAFPSLVQNPTNTGTVLRDEQRTLNQHPLVIPVKYKITDRNPLGLDTGGTAPSGGGIAGERGPEILNGKYLTTGPTYVPPGTKVTSRRQTAVILRNGDTRGLKRYDQGGIVPAGPVTINFNGVGMIGNRYELMRGVDRALRDRTRLLGTRR